ncbi:MAG: CapA family protein [Bacteroidota bacterium]
MKLLFLGDLCVSNPIDSSPFSKKVIGLFQEMNAVFINWEAPLIQRNFPKHKKAGPHIAQDPSVKLLLEKPYFTHAALANNHIYDYGLEGLRHSIEELQRVGIQTFGAGRNLEEVYQPCLVEHSGIKIGLISVGEAQFGVVKDDFDSTNGYAWALSQKIGKLIQSLKNSCDQVIILSHAGLEMESLPLPEWRSLYKSYIDWGADLVIGSHPHVIQGKETYQGKTIYYSLGNFFFNSSNTSEAWTTSMGIECEVSPTEIVCKEHFFNFQENTIHKISPIPTFNELSDCLRKENYALYMEAINEIVTRNWSNVYKSYYAFRQDRKTRKILNSKIFNKIVERKVIRGSELMLLHNIRIESHRFVVERALSLLTQTF